jgi:hypothetical protein
MLGSNFLFCSFLFWISIKFKFAGICVWKIYFTIFRKIMIS